MAKAENADFEEFNARIKNVKHVGFNRNYVGFCVWNLKNLNTKKMKKSILCFMVMFLSLGTFASPLMAAEGAPATESSIPEEMPAEVRVMLDRLNEIKDMDKSALTRMEKKELRVETRAIKSAMRASGNGIYLSVGALLIIIIIILLI